MGAVASQIIQDLTPMVEMNALGEHLARQAKEKGVLAIVILISTDRTQTREIRILRSSPVLDFYEGMHELLKLTEAADKNGTLQKRWIQEES